MTFLSEDFTKAVQSEQSADVDKQDKEHDVPEIVEAPYPHPVPPWVAQPVERFFDQQSIGHTPDAFDQIDEQEMSLRQRFNEHAATPQENSPDQIRGNERDDFERIDANSSLSERFNAHAQSLERE